MNFLTDPYEGHTPRIPALDPGSNYIKPHAPRRSVRALAPGEVPEPGAHLVTPWLGFAHSVRRPPAGGSIKKDWGKFREQTG